ncbi:hypothetical protein P7K49_003191 [Saguinus oedipus]|uniref:Uncharacterized protein n=1 Tax=Saguinus oedipus TaxID=9490 RepID=A0ABQ9WJH0_SAGOE|nr:hypothetical protein P7K49_003191 [Saguinus oedipus]
MGALCALLLPNLCMGWHEPGDGLKRSRHLHLKEEAAAQVHLAPLTRWGAAHELEGCELWASPPIPHWHPYGSNRAACVAGGSLSQAGAGDQLLEVTYSCRGVASAPPLLQEEEEEEEVAPLLYGAVIPVLNAEIRLGGVPHSAKASSQEQLGCQAMTQGLGTQRGLALLRGLGGPTAQEANDLPKGRWSEKG